MIWEKKKELEKLNQAVDQRKKEYAEYFQRQETLKNQSVTKEKWEEITVFSWHGLPSIHP